MFHDSALYIHVPFCSQKCGYCSFISEQGRESDIPLYVEAVKQEIVSRAAGKRVTSIYFGGGTPSLLSATEIGSTISVIRSICDVERGIEITMEANPGTINAAYLETVRKAGVNRLSLGIQSFIDRELALIGRIHSSEEGSEAVVLARTLGFDNTSIDLIYGLPEQTAVTWRMTLGRAIELNVEHISLYALTLEPYAPMRQAISEGRLTDIDPDLEADLYEMAEDILEENGYRHYEISNWSHPGKECNHNLVYWRNLPYIGVGVAAHSCIFGHRIANTASIDRYLADFRNSVACVPDLDELISPEIELAETLILGLRLCQGVDIAAFETRYDIDLRARYSGQFDLLAGYGLLEYDTGHIRLTRRGRLLSNEVFWRLLPDAAAVK